MKKLTALLGLAAATLIPASAYSAGVSNTIYYSISISGLTLAKASFNTRIEGDAFMISGDFGTTGLARAFKKWGGSASVKGTLSNGWFEPIHYSSSYNIGGSKRSFNAAFSSGNVTDFARVPAHKELPPEWVHVSKADLKNIADPMTALIKPMDGELCSGVVPVFDGETRMELHLSPKGKAQYREGRISTQAHVCAANFRLVSGYRKGHTDLEKVQKYKGFEVWLAKSPIANVYAPVQLKIPTQYGTLAISATRFGRVKPL